MTQLKSSFTTFLKAYSAPPSLLAEFENSNIWMRSTVSPDHSYLFNHVFEFFGHNASREEVDLNQAVLYEIREKPENEKQKEVLLPYKSFFNRKHSYKSGELISVFSFEKGQSILSPTLIYVPLTGVLLLVITVRLEEECQKIEHLISVNYHLRVSSKGAVATIETERKEHEKAQESENSISQLLSGYNGFAEGEGKFSWTLNTFSSYLLSEWENELKDLSPSRLQAFVYANLAEDMREEDFDQTYFRLRRVYSSNYIPAASYLSENEETAQVFEKIHYGASVEGAVVLVRKDESTFLSNYESTVVQRTIWSYLLAFHQRMALVSAAYETNSLFSNNRNPTTEELSHLIDQLAKLQLKCLFEEVSHYSQQNEFYYLVLKNLRVEQLFREVKEEVNEVNLILTEKWREEEVRDREEREETNRQNQRKIEVLLALLIIPQIWFAVLSTNVDNWGNFINDNSTIINGVNIAIWLVIAGGIFRLLLLSRKKQRDQKI